MGGGAVCETHVDRVSRQTASRSIPFNRFLVRAGLWVVGDTRAPIDSIFRYRAPRICLILRLIRAAQIFSVKVAECFAVVLDRKIRLNVRALLRCEASAAQISVLIHGISWRTMENDDPLPDSLGGRTELLGESGWFILLKGEGWYSGVFVLVSGEVGFAGFRAVGNLDVDAGDEPEE